MDFANGTPEISPAGMAFLMRALNPCGEHSAGSDGRPTDNALPLSGLWPFRGVVNIAPPWITQSTTVNSTSNWGLWLVSPPTFKMAFVAIASRTNQDPTEDEQALIWQAFNNRPTYHPDWKQVNDEYYFTIVRYDAADIAVDPKTGMSVDYKTGRLTGDGIVLFHNTPTLWDQGTIVSAQFPTDYKNVETMVARIPLTLEVEPHNLLISVQNPMLVTLSFPDPNGTEIFITVSITLPGTNTLASPIVSPYSGTGYMVNELGISEDPIGTLTRGTSFALNVFFDSVSNKLNVSFGSTFAVRQMYANKALLWPGNIVTNVTDPAGGTLVHTTMWTAPTLSSSGLVQVDPKFSAELMKDDDGLYMVRHPCQPVLGVQDWATLASIKAIRPGMDERVATLTSNGNLDVVDTNQNTYVIAVRGISYAAQPFVKMVRFYEATTTSKKLAVMMRERPPADDVAMQTYFAFAETAPHSYPPSMNFLGGLLRVITGAVQMIPVFMRTAKTIGQGVVKAVSWAEDNLLPAVETVGKFL